MKQISRNQILIQFSASFFISLLLIIYGAHHLSWLKGFFSESSYYFILALTAVWIWVLVKAYRSVQFNIPNFFLKHRTAFCLVLLVVSIIFLSVPKYFRVLSDETNLLSVSRSMTFDKRVDCVLEANFHDGKLLPISSMVEIRPFLFPFFTHLLHVILGYRPENVFILNYLSLTGLLLSVYLLLRAYLSEIWSLCGILLIVSQPIISLTATSGSYEIFNSFFLALTLLSLRWFITTRLPIAFEVLFVNLLMLANIRHESFMFLPLVFLFLGSYRFLKKEFFVSPAFTAFPLLFLGWLSQKLINVINNGILVDPHYRWFNRFHVKSFFYNVTAFFNYVCDWRGSLAFAGILNMLGIIAFLYFMYILLKRSKEGGEQRFFFLLSLLLIMTHFIVVTSFVGGVTSHPMNGRYYFPQLILLSVLPVAFAASLFKSPLAVHYGVLMSLVCFLSYHPKAMQDVLITKLNKIRENIIIRDFLDKYADKDTLIICAFPWQYTIYNRSAISFATANKNKTEIAEKLKKSIYKKIYVFQEVPYKSLRYFGGYTLDPFYQSKIVKNTVIKKNSYYLRISQVSGFTE